MCSVSIVCCGLIEWIGFLTIDEFDWLKEEKSGESNVGILEMYKTDYEKKWQIEVQ